MTTSCSAPKHRLIQFLSATPSAAHAAGRDRGLAGHREQPAVRIAQKGAGGNSVNVYDVIADFSQRGTNTATILPND
jgi:hypothetical protein